MTEADREILREVRAGLAEPMVDPVLIEAGGGVFRVSRATARAMERMLARLSVAERRVSTNVA